MGVFPSRSSAAQPSLGLPHSSVGASTYLTPSNTRSSSSPRQWRCFQRSSCNRTGAKVSLTLVGVFPAIRMIQTTWSGLPQVIRGVCHFQNARLPRASGGVSTEGICETQYRMPYSRQWERFLEASLTAKLKRSSLPQASWCASYSPHSRGCLLHVDEGCFSRFQ